MPKTAKKVAAEEAKVIKKLKGEERWLKWGLIVAGIIILLLLLFVGYATDWTAGLRKDSTTAPSATELDAAGATPANGINGTSSQGTSGTGGAGGTNRSGTTSTTNTSSTTTNNTSTNPSSGDSSLIDALREVYASTNAGGNMQDAINKANSLGLAADCTTVLLIQTCDISVGNNKVTIRGVQGTGLVTSVLNNF